MGARLAMLAAIGGSLLAPPHFAPAVQYPVGGTFVTTLVTADFDGDGAADIATTTTSYPGRVSVLLNEGDGTFATALDHLFGNPAPADPADLAVADVNGDDVPDLVVVSAAVPWVPVLLGVGDGTFTDAGCCSAPFDVGLPGSVAVGDVTGDERPDLVVAASGRRFLLYAGRGDGTFKGPKHWRSPPNPRSLALGDVDHDGDLDLAVVAISPDVVAVLLNDGAGTFGPATGYAVGRAPRDVSLADLDGDGWLDIVTANNGDTDASLLLNEADGTFATAVGWAQGGSSEAVAIGDINNDGRPDLVFANRPLDSNNVGVVINRGGGLFRPPAVFDAGTEPTAVAVADFDGDGHLDIAAGNQQSADASVLLAVPPTSSPRS